MAYIGNKLADAYTSFAKQDFTTSATTSYTLDNPVTNENEIALFINFVRQEPTTAYTASGTSLTLTSATSASDDMYCVFLGKAVQTVNPPNSSVGNSQLDVSAINSQTAETSIAGGDEVLIYDTSASALRKMTRTNFVSGVGGTNTPAFFAYNNSAQSINHGTWTKLTLSSELYDTDSNFDSSTNYRFTPTTAGKYFFQGNVSYNGSVADHYTILEFRKNGSSVGNHDYFVISYGSRGTDTGLTATIQLDMNGSSDYVELYTNHGMGTTRSTIGAFLGGYKIIGA